MTVADGVATYTVDIPSQGANTFQSFLMYVVDRDQPVKVENVRVRAYTQDDFEVAQLSGTFDGTTVEDDVYTFPQRQRLGQVLQTRMLLYPISFPLVVKSPSQALFLRVV